MLDIEKGSLEKCSMPYYRDLKCGEKVIKSRKNISKKKKGKSDFDNLIIGIKFPKKRINIEIFTITFILFASFIAISFLVCNTYF